MASKKQLAQIDKQIQASVSPPESGFVAFASKSDGLYQRRYGGPEEKLLVESKIIINQNAHGFSVGNAIKLYGSTWVKAKADSNSNAGTQGLVSEVVDVNNFCIINSGLLAGSFTIGANYFLSPDTAGSIFIQSNPEVWSIGNVREFIGTGTATGLEINIDVGQEIQEAVVPVSIWDLEDVDRTGWAEGKLLKFDANGNLVVGVDLQGILDSGIHLTDLSAIGAIDYNSTTGVFSIKTGYIVPTSTEKGNYDTAYGWGNHANAGYLKAITKALVEAVLTGNISSHGHSAYEPTIPKATGYLYWNGNAWSAVYQNYALADHNHSGQYTYYNAWNIIEGDNVQSAEVLNGNWVKFAAGDGLSVARAFQYNYLHTITYALNIMGLTNIMNPSDTHYIAIQASSQPSRISLWQLKQYIGSTGGVSDHGALTGLGDDDHTQYYNQTRGDARYAQLAGSSSQDFATKKLTAAQTIEATGDVKGETFTLGSSGWSFAVSSGKLVIKYNGTALMSLDTSGNIKAASEIYRGGL